jgi:hypothetical protein
VGFARESVGLSPATDNAGCARMAATIVISVNLVMSAPASFGRIVSGTPPLSAVRHFTSAIRLPVEQFAVSRLRPICATLRAIRLGSNLPNQLERALKIPAFLTLIITTTFALTAFSQAVPAAKETGRAVAESSKEAGDNIKATTSKEPKKSYNKAKAHVHKAKAHAHSHRAKADAKAAVK